MTRPARILIAGIGNIFLGDDAFGVEVARRLVRRRLPDGVRVVDFGIRGLDLTYALLDGYEAVILVDAAPRGGPPGTLYVLEPPAGRSRRAEATASSSRRTAWTRSRCCAWPRPWAGRSVACSWSAASPVPSTSRTTSGRR